MTNAEPVIFGENHLRIEELLASIETLTEENRALRQRHESLTTDRAGLLQKNEQVRARGAARPIRRGCRPMQPSVSASRAARNFSTPCSTGKA